MRVERIDLQKFRSLYDQFVKEHESTDQPLTHAELIQLVRFLVTEFKQNNFQFDHNPSNYWLSNRYIYNFIEGLGIDFFKYVSLLHRSNENFVTNQRLQTFLTSQNPAVVLRATVNSYQISRLSSEQIDFILSHAQVPGYIDLYTAKLNILQDKRFPVARLGIIEKSDPAFIRHPKFCDIISGLEQLVSFDKNPNETIVTPN